MRILQTLRKNKLLSVLFGLLICLSIVYFVDKYTSVFSEAVVSASDEETIVKKYLKDNISTIAPTKAVLGGSWMLLEAQIDTESNTGVVTYEDGHIQNKSNFAYEMKGEMVVKMTISDQEKPEISRP